MNWGSFVRIMGYSFSGKKNYHIQFFCFFLASLWLRRVNETGSFADFLFLVDLPQKRRTRIHFWDLVREKNKPEIPKQNPPSSSYVFIVVSQGLVWLYEWSVLTNRTCVRTSLTLPTCSRSSSTLWMLWKRYVCPYICLFLGCGGERGETSFHALQIVPGVSSWISSWS